jgi:hypothetical protein
MKNWIIRIPEPIPLGDTRFRAIVRAICSPDPVKVFGGGAVETVFTFPDQRLRGDFFAIFLTPQTDSTVHRDATMAPTDPNRSRSRLVGTTWPEPCDEKSA